MKKTCREILWAYIMQVERYVQDMHMVMVTRYESEGKNTFDDRIKERKQIGITLDSCTALVYENNSYTIIRCDKNKNVYKFEDGVKEIMKTIDL